MNNNIDNNINTTNVSSEQENTNNVETLLDKIKNLPIANDEKAVLMKQLKTNMMTPSKNENKNLENIKNKYLQNVPEQMLDSNYSNEGINAQQQYTTPHITNSQQYNPQHLQNQPSNLMTTAHFEILKNKLDSLQYELIDLLRHVKDYTQRYMNSVRQQDLDKIDDYIKRNKRKSKTR